MVTSTIEPIIKNERSVFFFLKAVLLSKFDIPQLKMFQLSAFNYLEMWFTSEEKRLSKSTKVWIHTRGNRRKHSKNLEERKTGLISIIQLNTLQSTSSTHPITWTSHPITWNVHDMDITVFSAVSMRLGLNLRSPGALGQIYIVGLSTATRREEVPDTAIPLPKPFYGCCIFPQIFPRGVLLTKCVFIWTNAMSLV